MSQAPHVAKPVPDELPYEVAELHAAVANLPVEQRARLEPLVEQVMESTRRRRRILTLVQEALGQLRLDMKYMMFDLEATRRERDEYRQKLDAQSGEAG